MKINKKLLDKLTLRPDEMIAGYLDPIDLEGGPGTIILAPKYDARTARIVQIGGSAFIIAKLRQCT